ncbi:hypoxanthine phosphoribosyltransferase [Tuanshanicoccus lijuaniae]|uniref:hypoxanthine phosphoribosyltransferase n=1 Tax=Aerococcaceae bacterium zg-1292 TaxID=2774330 RepID=UPI001937EF7C|nr:hypoxanthine phosphoribosyltransferase [Aerococcaceae bacterium zg-1292]MBF6626048.1 hypoxanthine phosphoribosyltransferase [Aerococcaceae bacterium zg-BR9]MBF6978864.1 hypoxanthine phosphoribosyltransferase [Aerococcaceae bacterium zg-BR22]MBS4455298.1 hypoxanthine phosphoribosyltransferase [Aerococcaceae bacterium zg-A91]MBS4457892.1 hypoxanthine phosphoribosyltransferase [Aerococcaceae bacterium zg-BR33]
MLEKDIERVVITREEIQEAAVRLGKQLTEDYRDKDVIVVGILRGAALFMMDVIREMDCYLEFDFMDVSSYHGGTTSTGEVKIIKDLDTAVEGRHILIIEDIIDTGRTLRYIMDLLKYRKAASVKVCTLTDKPDGRVEKDVYADYVGIEVPNEFLVGYGLDYEQKYRNLPYIGVLKPEVYKK